MSDVRLREAKEPDDVRLVRTMFEEYAAWLDVDLCFQDFQGELDSLPGPYVRPRGCLLLADVDGLPAGCVGVRALQAETAEMKRLWVRPDFRGLGVGRLLAEAAVAMARESGFQAMVLDTLADPRLAAARDIYERMGFREAPAYYHNPLDGVIYLRLDLVKPVPPAVQQGTPEGTATP